MLQEIMLILKGICVKSICEMLHADCHVDASDGLIDPKTPSIELRVCSLSQNVAPVCAYDEIARLWHISLSLQEVCL